MKSDASSCVKKKYIYLLKSPFLIFEYKADFIRMTIDQLSKYIGDISVFFLVTTYRPQHFNISYKSSEKKK